jgi:heptosyltransferase-2
MRTLVIKLNATGDVVRTTPLLRRLPGHVTWVTAPENLPLLDGMSEKLSCISWEDRQAALDSGYDLVINLEDDAAIAAFASSVRHDRRFGAYFDDRLGVRYTDDARGWFDLSLVSVHGKSRADQLKYLNRRSYQELLFEGLGLRFSGERYLLPRPRRTDLAGDVAIAPVAGPVWPMKNWAYYDVLARDLERNGLQVNVLPRRATLIEHLGDIANHRCLVSGDSLPMHLALGAGIPCVTLFTCTSPWEIHGYGLQRQIVSPLLGEYFYKRGMDPRATAAIPVEPVFDAVVDVLARQVAAPT